MKIYVGNLAYEVTEQDLREELRPSATKRVTESLVLAKVTEQEDIKISGPEIDAEIKNAKEATAENKDKLQDFLATPQARKSVEQLLLTRKTVQCLVEIAKGSGEGQTKGE